MDLASTSASMQTLYAEAYQKIIDSLFNKCIQLSALDSDDDSNEKSVISFEAVIAALTKIQNNLNNVKMQIPSDEMEKWRRHTWMTNPTKKIPFHLSHMFNLEYCTRAFLKFYEILFRFPGLVPDKTTDCESFRTLHLCEGPGAFISALNVYLQLYKGSVRERWNWYANSLNPHFEWNEPSSLFLDDELITATQSHWVFGPDNSGNIMYWNSEYLAQLEVSLGQFELVTADGSLYCQDDPREQEALTFPLIKQEIEIAKHLLAEGGSLVVKMYTFTMERTVQFLLGIIASFQAVYLLKPSCSKPGNSEIYMICMGYVRDSKLKLGTKTSLFQKILHCAQFFADYQKDMLQFNLVTFPISKELLFSQTLRRKQDEVLQKFESYLQVSLFNEIELDSWLTASDVFINSCRLECSNPWNYRHLHGQVESLRNISTDMAVCEINKMLFRACLLGEFDCPKQAFRIELCRLCQNTDWIQKQLNTPIPSSIITTTSVCTSAHIRQSLFMDLRTLVLLNSTDAEYSDVCDTLTTHRRIEISIASGNSSENDGINGNEVSAIAEEPILIKREEDWVQFLKKLCASDRIITEVRCDAQGALILSRFSASMFVILAVLFQEVSIELDAAAHMSIVCWKQNVQLKESIREMVKRLETLYSTSTPASVSVSTRLFALTTQMRHCGFARSELWEIDGSSGDTPYLRSLLTPPHGRHRHLFHY